MSDQPNEPKPERIAGQSPDLRAELRGKLRDLVPEAFAEGRLDADKLKALLGESGDPGAERYSFSWAGKRDAIAMLQVPTRATLIPDLDNSVNFDEAQHVFIEGENLEVLKVLYRSYFGRVKMIYIDPPYNTGNDFIYPDDFADPLDHYLRITGQKNGNGDYITSQVDRNGRIHSAWLSMMYPRLTLARQFLREDGLILASIDDNEVKNLRSLMDEIFGEENFVDTIIWKKRYGGGAKEKHLVTIHEYILVYARSKDSIADIFVPLTQDAIERYYKYKDENFEKRGPFRLHPLESMKSFEERANLRFAIKAPDGEMVSPKRQWRWGPTRVAKAVETGELHFSRDRDGRWVIATKQYLRGDEGQRETKFFSLIEDVYTQHATNEVVEIFGDARVFPFPKPSMLIEKLVQIGTNADDGDIVLDFLAGSGTTAQAVIGLNRKDGGNRRFILVQLPEKTGRNDFRTIADIARERIRRVIKKATDKGKNELKLASTDSRLINSFRAFKLGVSAFRSWSGVADKDADALATQIEAFADSFVPGWKPESVIWEAALREGYSLTSRIEKIPDTGKRNFWRVTDSEREQSFVICLDDTLTLDAVRALKLGKDALFVCRDVALDDTLSANLALQCRLKVL
jgi:adenine-specific DNA-methyltransferase